VTGLLPDAVREAVQAESVASASETFGVVALVVLLILLVEHEALRAGEGASARMTMVSAAMLPLLLTVTVMIGARVAAILL
jgi:hypothetical protein